MHWRLALGGLINVVLLVAASAGLSGVFIELAEQITGDIFAWPTGGPLSNPLYEVSNGHVMVSAAVLLAIFISSWFWASLLGASPGKALCGVRYVDPAGSPASAAGFLRRTILILALLGFILLARPMLGFVLGEAADPWSSLAFYVGVILAIGCLWPFRGGLSVVNAIAGVRPVLRSTGEAI